MRSSLNKVSGTFPASGNISTSGSGRLKAIITLCAILVSIAASAQFEDIFPDTINRKFNYLTGTFGGFEMNSDAIDVDFARGFYRGDFIGKDRKDRISKRLTAENRMGADLNYGIFYSWRPDSLFGSSDVSVFVSLENNEHYDVRYSHDLYRTVFYGNREFAGDTAYLGNFSTHLLRYQKLQFGVLWSNLDSTAKLGLAISALNAEQYFEMEAKQAELLTAADGEYMSFNTSINALRSDTSNKGFASFNGFGVSTDIYFEAPYKGKKRRGKLVISVMDIGIMAWNGKSQTYSMDSLYYFDGVEVENLFNAGDSSLNHFSADSVFAAITEMRTQSFTTSLPASVHIKQTTYYRNFEFTKGFRYMFNANYKGFYYLEGIYHFPNRLNAGINAGFGGYGKFSFGASVNKELGQGLYIGAASRHLEGVVAPKRFGGMGAFVTIRQKF
jgi:hypothetical protein